MVLTAKGLGVTILAVLGCMASLARAESPRPQVVTPDGFIRSWLVLGPFGGDDRWSKDHLADLGGPEQAEPKLGDKAAGRTWEETSVGDDGLLNLGSQDHAVAYACSYLECGADQDVLIRLGVDDGYALWLNGRKLAERHSNGTLQADQEQIVAKLKPRINRILIKVDNFTGGWGFYLRLVDLSKAPNVPPEGLRSWLTAPTEQEIKSAPWDMGITVPMGPIKATVVLSSKVITERISPLMFGSALLWWEGYTAPPADGGKSRAWKIYQEMGLTCLRFPGGADCHPYRWDSVAETHRVYNAAGFWKPWHEKTIPSGHYGYRTFLDFCRTYDIEPILQVSTMAYWDAKTGGLSWLNVAQDLKEIEPAVEYAANWVRDAKKSGYNVRYWEIGNEEGCYPRMSGKRYGQFVRRFVRAMKQVDPAIKIIATGHRHDWNVELLREAGEDIDFLSYHYWPLHEPVGDYPPGLGLIPCKFFSAQDLQNAPDDQLYLAHLAALEEGKKNLQYDLFEPLREFAPHAHVAWTEWNWPAFGSRFNYSIAQALLNVEQFFHMAAKDCRIAVYWAVSAWNFHMIDLYKGHPYYPFGDAFRLMRRYAKGQLREVKVESSAVEVKGVNLALVRAYWCGTDKFWALFILNHHPTEKARVTLSNLRQFAPAGSSLMLTRLVCPHLTRGAAENEAHTDYHKVIEEKVQAPETALELELDPHSLAILSQGY